MCKHSALSKINENRLHEKLQLKLKQGKSVNLIVIYSYTRHNPAPGGMTWSRSTNKLGQFSHFRGVFDQLYLHSEI